VSRRGAAVLAALGLLALVAGCADDSTSRSTTTTLTGSITVLAAASLTDVFDELGDEFEATHPGATVTFSYGASSDLATQVVQGAPADVLATANTSTMRQVTNADAADGDPQVFARNVLEIAVPPGNPGNVHTLADLANPDLVVALCARQVPCGSAAEKLLDLTGLSVTADSLETDVRSALTKVELGEVDAALVYRTDVQAAGAAVEGIEIPEADQVVNDYPIVALAGSTNRNLADAFVAYVLSAAAGDPLQAAGFLPPS
jgi:molybdate transport system substrate-binding protein